jgi:hypothetical protein
MHSRFQWEAEKGRALYHDTSLHPLGFISLVTEHKLIGAIIALAVVVFLVSIVKIIGAVRAAKRETGSQDDDNPA